MNCDGICKDCKHDFKRERLYRGKRIDNGEWFYGCYIWGSFLSNSEENAIVYPNTIGEFTGAFTGNGTMIFEGDIIDLPGWIVTYGTGMDCCYGMQVGWYIQRDNWESWTPLENTDRFVVIGNVHDNPELLLKN